MAIFNPTRYKHVTDLSKLVILLTQEYENLVQLKELYALVKRLPDYPRKAPLLEAIHSALYSQDHVDAAPCVGTSPPQPLTSAEVRQTPQCNSPNGTAL